MIAVPRPALQITQDRLHCSDGPAVQWPNGKRYYFLNGVQVTEQIVMTPGAQLDPRLVTTEQNAEVRREIVRKIGIERIAQALGAKVIDKEGDYELILLNLRDRARPYLKMLNPSIGVYHIEGVPPGTKTVKEALFSRRPAWMQAIPEDPIDGLDWYQQGDVYIVPRGAKSIKPQPKILT